MIIIFIILILLIILCQNLNNINEIISKNITQENFNLLYTDNNKLKSYPKIINLLFFLNDEKINNQSNYQIIIKLIEYFISNYEACLIDNSLANTLYSNNLLYKIKIMNLLNCFSLNNSNCLFLHKLNKIIIKFNSILDFYLNKMILIKKKYLYYNGYNINTNNDNFNNI